MRSKQWDWGKVCYYYGSSWEIQTDHIVPRGHNGVGEAPACGRCNRSKHGQIPAEWSDQISQSSRPEDRFRWKVIREWNYGRRNSFAQMVHRR